MKQISLIASYPKSGNTWLRVLLGNLMHEGEAPISINQLEIPWGISNRTMDDLLGVDTSDFDHNEVGHFIPFAYRALAASKANKPRFIKTHSKYVILDPDLSLFPQDAFHSVVYLIRNPLDVCISLANHSGSSIDDAIKVMEDNEFRFFYGESRPRSTPREWVSSWSDNVESWSNQKMLRILVIRYEDMVKETFAALSKIVDFCGLSFDDSHLNRAIRYSRIDELRKQEQESGFVEKSVKCKVFFKSGRIDGWKHVLSDAQIDKIVDSHGPTMRSLGYSTT